jgi:hypothetical protein
MACIDSPVGMKSIIRRRGCRRDDHLILSVPPEQNAAVCARKSPAEAGLSGSTPSDWPDLAAMPVVVAIVTMAVMVLRLRRDHRPEQNSGCKQRKQNLLHIVSPEK